MKKYLSILLTLVMVVSVIPFSCVTVYAESLDVCTEHSFGEWELVRLVSCGNAGTREREVRKCLNCGEKEYRYTGRFIEHDWIDWVVVREASCTIYGEEYRYCNICGDEEYRFPDATGHNVNEAGYCENCNENLNSSTEQDATSVENNIFKIFIDFIYLIMEFFVGLG